MQIEPLPQGFGAVVTDLDVRKDDAAEISALQETFIDRHLLVFRDCGLLTPGQQAEIVGWFGKSGADGGSYGEIATTMDNAMDRGRAILPFHCDITYFPYPLEGISLHTIELPQVETSTTYVSNAVAWDTLPAALQDDLRRRKARHFYEDDGKMGTEITLFEHWHPVCMPHYRTGRPLLFVTEHHVEQIEGYGPEESARLLKQLFAHLYAPERRYEHIWRKGDLVIWDNYAVQHARTREAHPSEGRRVLQRVSFGEHGFAEQFAVLRKEAAKGIKAI